MPEGNVNLDEMNKLVTATATAFEEFTKTNDEKLKQLVTKGSVDVLVTDKLKKLNDTMDAALEKQQELIAASEAATKSRLDAVETLAARPNPGKQDGVDPEEAKQMERFITLLRKGEKGANPIAQLQLESKATTGSVDSDPDGGYLVPPTWANRMIQRSFETTPMRQLCTIMTTTGDDIEFPNDVVDVDANWVGEKAARVQTKSIKPGKIRIPVHEVYAFPKLTQKLLDDNAFNLEAYLSNRITDKISRVENNAFIIGTGNGQPTGFLNYSTDTAADETRSWNKLQYKPTGASGAFVAAASSPGDCLIDLVQMLKVAYLGGASWLMPRAVIGLVRELKNSVGGYLWQPNYQIGVPSTLLEYPVTIAPDMPVVAANSYSAAFGNFKEGYTILDRMGIRLLRDPYSDKPNIGFYFTKRTGGDVVNFDAIKLLKFSTT